MKRLFTTLMLFFYTLRLDAQVLDTIQRDTASQKPLKNLTIGFYLDLYYGYNSLHPKSGDIPFFVNSNRHNELNINLAYIDLRYQTSQVRGRFVPGFGTYMDANYVLERGSLKNIVEASAGFRPFKKKEIWLDAGVLGSPFTNESAICKDQFMYTRSLAPEYVPYFLSGFKFSIPAGRKLILNGYLLNGWQQIRDQNNQKAFATQVEFRPNSKHLFNWNTFIGDERQPSMPEYRTRYFSDLYWIYNPDGKVSFSTCFYGGFQASVQHNILNKNTTWYQANIISRLRLSQNHSISGRMEYFSDPNNIFNPIATRDFTLWGGGLCYNYAIYKELTFRLEGRYLRGKEKIFEKAQSNGTIGVNNNLWIISNLTFSL